MRFPVLFTIVALCAFLNSPSLVQNQEARSRKVVSQIAPTYPAIARSLNLAGSVKVEATVSPTGSVKSVEVKGGNPVFAQAAADAVTKWKWEPTGHATQELVQLNFSPQ